MGLCVSGGRRVNLAFNTRVSHAAQASGSRNRIAPPFGSDDRSSPSDVFRKAARQIAADQIWYCSSQHSESVVLILATGPANKFRRTA